MKRILALLILLSMMISFVLPFIDNNLTENDIAKSIFISDIRYELPIEKAIEIKEKSDIVDTFIQEMQTKMEGIEHITDKKEWFLAYKDIVFEYQHILDPPETIYDYFTEDELDMFFRVVQAEVGDEYGFIQKANVASVIINRIENERHFGNSILEVLTSDQFCTVRTGRYKTVEVSETTILACEYAFSIEDTTNGALFFDSNGVLDYDFMFSDKAHSFYKIKGE